MRYSIVMREQRKKLPSDYPQFTFRIHSEEEKVKLNKMIEEVLRLYRSRQSMEVILLNKNDIILEALTKGLSAMKLNPPRKPKKLNSV